MNRFGFYENFIDKTRDETYTVKSGDTLYKIAKKYGVSVNSLMEANAFTNTQIVPNQVIVIPVKIPSGAMYFEEYEIEPNDTIYNIANKLGISPDLITRYNDITKLVLQENQILYIPKTYKLYTIVDGDTLESILKKNNMTIEELFEANKNKWLIVGQTINVM